MTKAPELPLTEEELDTLVSIGIRRAEALERSQSPAAADAWHEVMVYEERLATLLPAQEITGGVARAGAITAALAAGKPLKASQLAAEYLADGSLPAERRRTIERTLRDYELRRGKRFPSLARKGLLAELDQWRAIVPNELQVFPAPV